jgi:hypothetical protein
VTIVLIMLVVFGLLLLGMAYDMKWFPFRYRRMR